MANERRVLLYGRDRTLVELRGKILELSRFTANATTVASEALELIRTGALDLIILCQTLSDKECLEMLREASAHPAMKRLVLTHGTRNLPPSLFDGECNPNDGPECLIRQTAMLLKVAANFPKGSRRPQA